MSKTEMTLLQPDRDEIGPDPRSPLMDSPNRLKMGSFFMNCQRGATPTLAEGSIAYLDWEQQVRIVQASEDAGLDAVIPVARWKGFAGPSHFHHEVYETLIWAAGMAALTKRVAVFATVHVPLLHPVRAAKEMATIDHISGGRFALNVVCGWNVAEFEMFGYKQESHDGRYALGSEWTRFTKKLWSAEEPFDWNGKFFQSKGAISLPRPIQRRPMIMSAGQSPAGQDYAATDADICYVLAQDMSQVSRLVREIRARADQKGRNVQVWMYVGLLCAESEAEVKRQYDYFVNEKGDWEAVQDSIRQIMGGGSQSLGIETSRESQERLLAWYGAYNVMGTPEQVVEKLAAMSAAGIDGIAVAWMDYEQGIEVYRREILPLARSAGLRV